MTKYVTVDTVADAAYAAGFRGEALAIAVAVAKGEAGQGAPAGMWADAEAIGDTTLENATWGPSIGCWQVRTIKADRGRGTSRDRDLLYGNVIAQAQAAYAIAGGNVTTGSANPNRGWGHWTIWKNGTHRKYLDEARAAGKRREALGGTGSISGGGSAGAEDTTSASAPATGERSRDVVIPAGAISAAGVAPRNITDLVLTGTASGSTDKSGPFILDGTVDLTLDESSEMSLVLANPGHRFIGNPAGTKGYGWLRTAVHWRGLGFVVAATELAEGVEESGVVNLSCRDYYVDRLKRTNVDAAGKASGRATGVDVGGKNISPTEYASIQARAVGLRFMGEGSPRRTDIAPERGDDGVFESPWEVMHRLAGELGYLCFVAGDVLYYGRPSWLVERGTEVKVGLRYGGWGDPSLDIIGTPNFRDTVDDFHGADLTIKLPRRRGEMVRPGMRLAAQGRPQMSGTWLVTGVSWDLRPHLPVTIEATRPIDPLVVAKTPTGDPDDAGIDKAPTSSAAGGSTPAPPTGGGSTGGRQSPPVSQRLTTDQRIRLFGQPGDRARIVVVTTPWGISCSVHRDVSRIFLTACGAAKASSSWVPRRIDSYAYRTIRGGTDWSLHSWALAWDIFSSPPGVAPPGGVWGPESAPDAAFRNAFARYGFYLGAEFSSRKDYPHIEWAGSPPASAAAAA